MKKISGIYEIRNIINGKRYIGSSVDVNFRLKYHKCLLNKNRHFSKHLQSAWNKYGKAAFIFKHLLICDPESNLTFEQSALDKLRPEYNKAKEALAPMTGLSQSDEAKQKIRLANLGNKYALGFKQSDETRQNMSLARKGKTHIGHKLSDEHKQKISLSLIGNKRGLGYRHTDEWKKEASARLSGNKYAIGAIRSDEFRKKISIANIGKKISSEQKEKISVALKGNKKSVVRVLSEIHKKRIGLSNKRRWIEKNNQRSIT